MVQRKLVAHYLQTLPEKEKEEMTYEEARDQAAEKYASLCYPHGDRHRSVLLAHKSGADWHRERARGLVEALKAVVHRHDTTGVSAPFGVSNGTAKICRDAIADYEGDE